MSFFDMEAGEITKVKVTLLSPIKRRQFPIKFHRDLAVGDAVFIHVRGIPRPFKTDVKLMGV